MFGLFGKRDSKPKLSVGGSVMLSYPESEWSAPQVGFAGTETVEYAKARDEVYSRRFGDAHQVFHEMPPLIPHIDVMEYSRNENDGSFRILVTSGMSDLAMAVPAKAEAPRRVELIFYCSEPKREYAETLRLLGRFPHDQKTWIGPGHTILNGNPPAPLWDSAKLDTFLFLPTLIREDRDLQDELILGGDGVQFLWVVPITTPECNLKLAEGTNALLDLFTKNRHPHIFDPNRPSYV